VAELDKRHVVKAKRLVSEKFPEMADTKPSVSEKQVQSKGALEGEQLARMRYVLTFEKDVSLPGGNELKRLVRVTMDDTGDVIRLTSSK
jgi:hypothetical protein